MTRTSRASVEVVLQVSVGRTQGMKIQEGLVQVLLQGPGGSHGIEGFTPLISRWLLHVLEEGAASVLAFRRRLPASSFWKKWPTPSRATSSDRNGSPEREMRTWRKIITSLQSAVWNLEGRMVFYPCPGEHFISIPHCI